MSGAELIDGRIVIDKVPVRVLTDNKPITITMDRPKRFRVETDIDSTDLIARRLEYKTKWN